MSDLKESFYVIARYLDGRAHFAETPNEHALESHADKEAKRLAEQHGGKFIVFQAVTVMEKVTVTERRLGNPDIPF